MHPPCKFNNFNVITWDNLKSLWVTFVLAMKALALDVGAGTVDILLYEEGKPVENSTKLVLPSPPRYFAESIKQATSSGVNVTLSGYTIGGGPLTPKVRKHIQAGYNVYMTPSAAYSIRNRLTEVKEMGVKVIKDVKEAEGKHIKLDEVRLPKIEAFLGAYGETIRDVDFVALSVKDHGAPGKKMSNREFRIDKFKEYMSRDPTLNSFLFKDDKVPEYYIRMRSGVEAVKAFLPDMEVYVMDTSPSAVRGCLEDPRVDDKGTVLAVNVGNGHTMAAVVKGREILGFFEHHTGALSGERLEDLLVRLGEGELTHSEIFEEGGHGAVMLGEMHGFNGLDAVAVTGPRRGILKQCPFKYVNAAPGGDVMMTGTVGILRTVLEKLTKLA